MLCGPLLVPFNSALVTLGFQFTAGGAGCSGLAALLPLPLPSNPALAGLPMSSQFVGLCVPTGTTMSNCLSWVLQ